MADRFKVDVFTLNWAFYVGKHLHSIEEKLADAIRSDEPDRALFLCGMARKECRKLIEAIQMVELNIRHELPREKPQLRAVGEK